MKIIKVNLKKYSYNIVIGSNIIGRIGKFIQRLNLGPDAYIITNAAIKNRYGKILNKALGLYGFSSKFKLIPDTEKSKSLHMAYSAIKDMADYDRKKRVFLVALGGGVIGDLTGFIASIYKRGIPYIQIPTTLLAQVDSSIGGKTAVDLMFGKNLVGAFYQPKFVLSDTALLKTLDLRQITSGLSEVIKYAIIKDPVLFSYLEKKYKDIILKKNIALEFIVSRSSAIKTQIVQQDEREEKGIRTILNFGHTIGHAIEAAGNYKKYNHGEAVALGMLVASDISQMLGFVNKDIPLRIEVIIKKVGLPVKINKISIEAIIKAHYLDKKFIGPTNRFVLIERIGKTKIVENIPLRIIRRALRKRIQG